MKKYRVNTKGVDTNYDHVNASNRIFLCDVTHYVTQSIPVGQTIPFPPHEFIEITWQLVCMATLHPLQFSFYPIPIALNVLCVVGSTK